MNAKSFLSRGHGTERYLVDVRVNPESRDAYAALLPGATLPSGTLVAAFHRDENTGKAGPIFVMEKDARAWKFRVYAADGSVSEHGVLALCERCHSESRADSLFGLPHENEK